MTGAGEIPNVGALSVPGGRTGILHRQVRIADRGVAAASLFGAMLESTTIGRDLRRTCARD